MIMRHAPTRRPAAFLAALAMWAAACGSTATTGDNPTTSTGNDTPPAADSGSSPDSADSAEAAVSSPGTAAASTSTSSAPAPAPTLTETERETPPATETQTETATATTAPTAGTDEDGGQEPPADNPAPEPEPEPDPDPEPVADPDALLPGEQPPDPVETFDETTDRVGEIVMLGQSVQLTKIREACPPQDHITIGGFDDCEDYLRGAQYRYVYQPIRLMIGSRYQTPPREEPSPDPRYDTYQAIDRYTVLGFENIPPEYIPGPVSGNTKEKIWFNVTEKLEQIYAFPGQEPYTPTNGTFTVVRSHVAVGGDDTREYDNGQLVGALVAIEESQNPEKITCPARELIAQIRAEDGLGLDGRPLEIG